MAMILTKWPRLLLVGKKVTEEQADEIILRTTPYFLSNDGEWIQQVGQVLGVRLQDEWSEEGQKELDSWHKSVHSLDLCYLNNHQIMSSWLSGPHGWCDWEGNIGSTNWNIGKWPGVDDITHDLELIASAFPFLSFRMQLAEEEGMGDLCGEWHVANGSWEEVTPVTRITKEELSEETIISTILGISPHEGRGVSLERLDRAYANLMKRISG